MGTPSKKYALTDASLMIFTKCGVFIRTLIKIWWKGRSIMLLSTEESF